jgi:hypothetical protein
MQRPKMPSDTHNIQNLVKSSHNTISKIQKIIDRFNPESNTQDQIEEIEYYLSDVSSFLDNIHETSDIVYNHIDETDDYIHGIKYALEHGLSDVLRTNNSTVVLNTDQIHNLSINENYTSLAEKFGIEPRGFNFEGGGWIFDIVDPKRWVVTRLAHGI